MDQLNTTVYVVDRDEPADGVVVLTLAPSNGGDLPHWTPGAHIDVGIHPGLIRQYSLCGDPARRNRYTIAVRVDPAGAGGSTAVGTMRTGDRLCVSAPRNNFDLVPAGRYLFIAGGIGITPLLPMIAHVDAAGAPWQLVYAGRTQPSMPFTDLLLHHGTGAVSIYADDECGDIDVRAILEARTPNTEIYCCGPEGLIVAVEEALEPSERPHLHVERFRPAPRASATGHPFQVELARSGISLNVPHDASVLDVLRMHDLEVPFSCREGTCGTCETPVLAGEVDHRDSVLSPDEREANEFMMLCVSRAKGDRLVLDR